MIDRRCLFAACATAAVAPALSRAHAQPTKWPARFVRLAVPLPPGGGTGAIARD